MVMASSFVVRIGHALMMPEGLRRLKRSAYRIVGHEVCGAPVMMGRSVYDRGEAAVHVHKRYKMMMKVASTIP